MCNDLLNQLQGDVKSSSVSLETAIIRNGILLLISRKVEKVKISEQILTPLYV